MHILGTRTEIKVSTTAERNKVIKSVFDNKNINSIKKPDTIKPEDTLSGALALDLLKTYEK